MGLLFWIASFFIIQSQPVFANDNNELLADSLYPEQEICGTLDLVQYGSFEEPVLTISHTPFKVPVFAFEVDSRQIKEYVKANVVTLGSKSVHGSWVTFHDPITICLEGQMTSINFKTNKITRVDPATLTLF